MKDFDYRGVIQVITDAKPSHLALISFLVLPLVANYWLEALTTLFPTPTQEAKYWRLGFLAGIYVFCLGWLVYENGKIKNLETRRDQIAGRMIANDWTKISFESARKALRKDASDADIFAVIEAFPKALKYQRLKKKDEQRNYVLDGEGKQVYLHGVGLLLAGDSEAE